MYFFWSRQKNYAVQLLKCPFKRISLKRTVWMKTCTWRSSCCQKGSRESCKALHRWKRKITLATYLSLTSSIFYHGDSSMVRYLWYKVWICSVGNLPGDRFKALANLSGKLHRKTGLAVSVLQNKWNRLQLQAMPDFLYDCWKDVIAWWSRALLPVHPPAWFPPPFIKNYLFILFGFC